MWHVTHTLALVAPETSENEPAGHSTHALAFGAPALPENEPAAHGTHAPETGASLYRPAAHSAQTPPFGPLYPASHAQLLTNPLDAGAREFSGHRLQFALPSGDHCPSSHGRHVSLPVAPKPTEYNPTEQFEHAVRPIWLFHVPGLQIRHVCDPAACAYPLLQ
jgi:hypothetical protein